MEGDFTVTEKKSEETTGERITLTRMEDSERMNTDSKEEDSASENNRKVNLTLSVGWKIVSI